MIKKVTSGETDDSKIKKKTIKKPKKNNTKKSSKKKSDVAWNELLESYTARKRYEDNK